LELRREVKFRLGSPWINFHRIAAGCLDRIRHARPGRQRVDARPRHCSGNLDHDQCERWTGANRVARTGFGACGRPNDFNLAGGLRGDDSCYGKRPHHE
jgi:hypothetical protein